MRSFLSKTLDALYVASVILFIVAVGMVAMFWLVTSLHGSVVPVPRMRAVQPQERWPVISPTADVRLDGRACPMADVPTTAELEELGFAADRATINRMYFRSAK